MARAMRARAVALVVGLGLIRDAASISPRPSNGNCPCDDPILGQGTCYEPVCPEGYFKCCSTCKEAPCYDTKNLELSWRGIPECIRCEPGDYCPGCDTFKKCPYNSQPGREGRRISAAGATALSSCESCPVGRQASFDDSTCMETYTDVCKEDIVQRCIRNCKAAEPWRGKNLTACERMKCTVYCARQWSAACGDVVGKFCSFTVTPFTNQNDGLVAEEGAGILVGCDVDCNAAASVGPLRATMIGSLLVVLLSCRHGRA